MSDSIDRVFVHALNTVKRIPRTGSARPPPSDRLKLYGLYKQSMEGNVEGVMKRPEGHGQEAAAEQEKWDAWSAQHGCTRTEAKRRYISTLIETMHKYASTTPESRELVVELEFVWDQIKSNSVTSTTSSPLGAQHPERSSLRDIPPSYASIGPSTSRENPTSSSALKTLQPVSDNDSTSISSSSQFPAPRRKPSNSDHDPDPGGATTTSPSRRRDPEIRTRKWRQRIERTLVKMTIEIAALREQLEAARRHHPRRGGGDVVGTRKMGKRAWVWLFSVAVAAVRHVLVDALLLGLWMLWVGRGDQGMGSAVGQLVGVLRERMRIVGLGGVWMRIS